MAYDYNSYFGRKGSAADLLEDAVGAAVCIAFLPAALILAIIDRIRGT